MVWSVFDSPNLDSCYWNTQTTGQTLAASSGTGTGAVGLTTAQMKNQASFVGWSSSVWNMDAGINNGYPYLKWQNPSGTPLPVEMTSFTATATNNSATLRWNTATEVNNYGFEIERRKVIESMSS